MRDVAQPRWETKLLGEVCRFIGGGTPSKQNPAFWGGNFPWVSPKDMKSEIVSDSIDHVTESAIDQSAAKRIPEGSLLIVVRSGILARTIPIAIAGRELTVNQDLKAMVPDKGLDCHFLAYFLRSAEGQLLDRVTRGATVHKLDMPVIKSLPIPLPPLEEQRRIVAILDEAFEGLTRVRAHAEANLQNARELFSETEAKLFRDISKGSTKTTLGELATFRNGLNYSRTSQGEEVKVVGVGDFQDNFTIPTETISSTKIDGRLGNDDKLFAGDILAVRSNGNRELIGRTMLMPECDVPISFSGFTIRIRLNGKDVMPEYACSYLRTKTAREKLTAGGGGANISNLNQRILSSLPISYPDKDGQRATLDRLQELRENSKRLHERYAFKLHDIDHLRQSLLQKAFSGELTASKRIHSVRSANDYTVLTAQIMALAFSRHQRSGTEKTFGHVKAQKTLHLAEAVAGIELGRQPFRDAAGPNDMGHMTAANDWARANDVFDFRKRENGYTFHGKRGLDDAVRAVKAQLGDQTQKLIDVIDLLVPMRTMEAEVFATVHAAWNNMIIDGAEVSDEAIVRAAREDWHPDKMKIERSMFFEAISKIKKAGIEPDGSAKYVPAKQEALL